MALTKKQRDAINERLGMARALAATNPVAAQNYAQAAVNIATRSGTAQNQTAVTRAANQIRSSNVTPSPGIQPGSGQTETGSGTDTGGGDTDIPPADTGPTPEEIADRQARQDASAFLNERLSQWGLSGLGGLINDLLVEFGPNAPSAVMARVRQSEPYKQRFKGLLTLRSKGITDIADEGEYLRIESQYREAFRQAGLRDYLGQTGSQAEYDAIARLVGDFSVSVDEVRERITDAQRVVADTPQEVRDSLQRFYGIDPNLLTQYVLDPQRTTTEIQRRANAAIVGGYAQRAGLEFGAGVSERIGEFLGGERNITGTQIEPQLSEIADIQRSTQRLAEIEQSELSAETSALSALNLDQESRERVRTLQSRERARFSGRSGITSSSLSMGPGI